MDIEQIAALCAVLGFICKALHLLWKKFRNPIKKLFRCWIDKIVEFLTWIKEHL